MIDENVSSFSLDLITGSLSSIAKAKAKHARIITNLILKTCLALINSGAGMPTSRRRHQSHHGRKLLLVEVGRKGRRRDRRSLRSIVGSVPWHLVDCVMSVCSLMIARSGCRIRREELLPCLCEVSWFLVELLTGFMDAHNLYYL